MMPRPSIYYNDNCPQVCAWIRQLMLTGCSAGMESGGQLNPAFSGWLQGFPEAWCHAALTARLRKAPKKPVA